MFSEFTDGLARLFAMPPSQALQQATFGQWLLIGLISAAMLRLFTKD